MKHTITINQENNPSHIIHLDQKKIPITIKKLPKTVAYQIQNIPILTTTTKTLKNMTITQIRQKNKTITRPTHIIIIENTKTKEQLKIETIKENPQITPHRSTSEELHETLKEIQKTLKPEQETQIKLKDTVLYQKDRKIKEYRNSRYAQIILQKINNNTKLTLQEAEYQAQKEYYKHISFDKTNLTYKLTLNRKTINRYRKLTHALHEKHIRTNNTDTEEETLCQSIENNTQPLPPRPWNNQLHKLYKNHNKYATTKHENTPKYNNPDVTTLTKKGKINHTMIRNIQKPLRNIIQKNKMYQITKQNKKKHKTYYKTNKKTLAMYIRDKMEENSYRLTSNEITEYEKQYLKEKEKYKRQHHEQYKIIDYYRIQTVKLKQKVTYKEQYQMERLKK